MPYNMRTYASEVMHRLGRYDVARSVDSGMLETVVNLARHEVQLATLQAVPERYSRRHRPTTAAAVSYVDSAKMFEYDMATNGTRTVTNLVGSIDLPQDFIIDVTVGVGTAPIAVNPVLWQARPVSKRDLYTVLTKSFAKPTPHNPVYTIEKSTTSNNYRLLISTGTALPLANEVEIWYLAKLPWLQISNSTGAPDPEVRIGYDLQELVVVIACKKILETLNIIDGRQIIMQDIEMMISSLQREYAGRIDRSRLLVEAKESTVPNVPIPNANAIKV
jgi:hypothetical protein